MSLEKIIESFRPTQKESSLYKREALSYIRHKKFKSFERMIR
jgi:hypothetical protein